MSKFGELVNVDKPVLLVFYKEHSEPCDGVNIMSRNLAATFGDQVSVIKIDIDKNEELSQALRIKALPTFIIYKDGSQIWRKGGGTDEHTIIGAVKGSLEK